MSDHEFEITADAETFVELNNDIQLEIKTYHTEEEGGEFVETDIKYLRKGVCDFMKGPYKKFLYPQIKEKSNFPHFEKCPLEPV